VGLVSAGAQQLLEEEGFEGHSLSQWLSSLAEVRAQVGAQADSINRAMERLEYLCERDLRKEMAALREHAKSTLSEEIGALFDAGLPAVHIDAGGLDQHTKEDQLQAPGQMFKDWVSAVDRKLGLISMVLVEQQALLAEMRTTEDMLPPSKSKFLCPPEDKLLATSVFPHSVAKEEKANIIGEIPKLVYPISGRREKLDMRVEGKDSMYPESLTSSLNEMKHVAPVPCGGAELRLEGIRTAMAAPTSSAGLSPLLVPLSVSTAEEQCHPGAAVASQLASAREMPRSAPSLGVADLKLGDLDMQPVAGVVPPPSPAQTQAQNFLDRFGWEQGRSGQTIPRGCRPPAL
jgi:hypothetical protein